MPDPLSHGTAGNVTTLSYDLRGRKIGMVDLDMGSWSYVYDALGQLKKQTDAKAQSSTMAYDLLGRLTQRAEPDLVSNWYYDKYKGGGACAKGIGKLCQSETDHGYNKTINYDTAGRFVSQAATLDTTSYNDSASYDTATGRLLTRTYPGGNVVVKYVYTTLGYLKEVRNNATNALYWTANSLDAEGHLLQQTYGNNVVTQQTYNPANGRLTGIIAVAGNSVQNLGYQYDALGNITIRTDTNQNLTETFTYDSLNRLATGTVSATAVSPALTTTYAYDTIGNLTSRSDLGGYTYPASGAASVRPHALSRVNLTAGGYRTYGYDANGNLTTATQYNASNAVVPGNGKVASWTSFNMVSVIYNDATSNVKLELSSYGPEHQRLKSVVTTATDTQTTYYLNPDNSGGLFYEKQTKTSNNSTEQRHYITAYGVAVAMVKQVTIGTAVTTTTRYFHRDNLGSTTAITDEAGAVVERLAYEPFGNRRFPSGVTDPNNTIVAQNTSRGFTNHEHFDGLDVVHMNGRIYDPVVGRFMSPDPVVQAPYDLQSYNRYSYVLNNPLLYTDPSGYSWWTKIRNHLIRVAAAYADSQNPSCPGCFSAAVGSYQGYQSGGWTGAVTGGIQGYYSYQYPLTDKAGNINWSNVATQAEIIESAKMNLNQAAYLTGSC